MQDFHQTLNLINSFATFNLGPQENIARPAGFLTLTCQQQDNKQNIEQLTQLKDIYLNRLMTFKNRQRQYNHLDQEYTIQDMNNDVNVQKILGLFKRIEPKRIRAFEDDFNEKYEFNKTLYTQNDEYELEDQTGKVRLEFKITQGKPSFNPISLPYGIIVKLQGYYKPKTNKYIVTNVSRPKYANFKKLKMNSLRDKYILVINEPTLDTLVQFKNYLLNVNNQISRNIQQLVIIGGLKFFDLNQIKQFDMLVAEIGEYIDTFLIPSSGDYKQHIFPLKPYHPCMLQKCIQRGSNDKVKTCSNPQILQSNKQHTYMKMLVSCGENIQNLKANCQVDCSQTFSEELQLMRMMIKFGHLCPSSCFSLPISSYKTDPLLIKEIPHLMIHGKCKTFETDYFEDTEIGNDYQVQVKVRLVALGQNQMALISLKSNKLQTTQFHL